jgi:hypothetical protein
MITHDDKTKVSDLYRISAGDFFTFIFPPPIELCNKNTLLNKQYNLEEFGADSLRDWRVQNWTTGAPHIFGENERTISEHGDYMTMRFDTKIFPPIGIYEELEKQGYRVKAYFFEPGMAFCGSFIYGILEYVEYLKGDRDIPMDVNWIFNIEEWERIGRFSEEEERNPYDSEGISVSESSNLDDAKNVEVSVIDNDDMSYFQNVANGK